MDIRPWYKRWFSSVTSSVGGDAVRSAADRGEAEAQFSLGVSYGSRGDGASDLGEAARWYRKAAEQDHPLAQFNLGVMLANGQGVATDEAEALRWMRRAAEGGDAGAQYDLGTRCHRSSLNPGGTGVGEDRVEAYKWLALAAAQGYRGASAAWERLTLSLSRVELADGVQRAAAFRVRGGRLALGGEPRGGE